MSTDHSVAEFVLSHRTPALTASAWVITEIGNELTLILATLALVVVLYVRRRRAEALVVIIGMGGAAVLTLLLKNLVQRSRPDTAYRVAGAAVDHSYSFPSGHTLHTTVFVILLIGVLWPELERRSARVTGSMAAGCVAIAVAGSRVYLGYHWLTDVVGGLLIGATWAGLVVMWLTRHSINASAG